MPDQLIAFALDERYYALRVSSVERVIRAVDVVPLPAAPEIVSGVIDIGGRIIPVIDIRRRFRLPEHEIDPDDEMIVANTSKRSVVLIVDSISGVIEPPNESIVPANQVLPEMEYVDGVVRYEGGLILIHDLDTFLSLDEERRLDDAISPMSVVTGAGRRERKT